MGESRPIRRQRVRWQSWPAIISLGRRLALLLVLLAPAAVSAVADSVRFRSYGPEQGLSQISAGEILEDRQGFLWVGTQDGLNRFDGYGFRIYRHVADNLNSLSDNYVTALAEDSDGGIWVGTQNGLNRLDPAHDRIERFASGTSLGMLRDGLIQALHAGSDGTLYVSTRRGGVQRFDGSTRQFEPVPALPPFVNRQRLLHLHADGRLLLGNDADVWEIDPARSSAQRLLAGVLPDSSSFIVATPRPGGGYALGAIDGGIYLVAADGRVEQHLSADGSRAGLPDDAVRALLFDPGGRLWIGTVQGLARLELDGSVSIWRHRAGDPHALPGDRVVALHSDRRGLLWIGTWTGGLARFDPESERFRVTRQQGGPANLPANAVTAIAADSEGQLWLGMVDRGGVLQLAADGRLLRACSSRPESSPRLASDDVTSLLVEPRGTWVGYVRGGVDLLQGDGSVRRFPTGLGARALPVSPSQALLLDREGTLWIGLLGGGLHALCATCEDLRHWAVDAGGQSGPLGSSINDILEDRDGRLWFAIRRGGLSWYEPRTQRWGGLSSRSTGALALANDSVTTLLEDDRGILWIGSQGGGISRIERGANGEPVAIKQYSEADGLASSMVGAILDGGDGQLWISTTRGLCRFAVQTENFACLGDRDPALAVDFFVGAAARDAAGGLHFGSSRGLVSIAEPGKVRFESQPAALVLTELRIANRRVEAAALPQARAIEYAEQVQLGHDQDLVTLEFAALDLRRAATLRYRYRLLGRDDDWIDTDAGRRVATYTGLPAGKYRFEVEARDGDMLSGTRALDIEVLPAPWLAPGARFAYAVLLGLLIALAGWRYRVRLKEREGTRDALAQSEAMLKYSLWGSRGELWDADLRSGKLTRRNRLEHLEVSRRAGAETLEAYTPFVHPEDRAHFRDALVACVKGTQDLFECSYRSADVDGQWRWLLSRGRVFARDVQGRAIRMVGTTFDISELRASEQARRSSEDRLNLALWGSGDEIWDIDLIKGFVRRENPLAGTELGSETRFPTLVDYLEYVHPADQVRLREALIAHVKGEVDHFECSYRTRARAGGWLWLLGKGRVLERDAQGRAVRMVGTNRDISLLKQVEDDLRRLNEELETRVQRRTEALLKSNAELKHTLEQLTRMQRQLVEAEKLAALGGLVAGVAHEINTPLGVGVTAASHLQQETLRLLRAVEQGRMTRADLDHYLEQAQLSSDLVLRNLDRASQLVRSFKQVAVDQSSEQRRVFRLREYLEEILLSLHPRIKKLRTDVTIECDEDLVMDTYPGALYQIVVNLVINSLVHAFDEQHGGRIRISAQRVGDDIVIDYRDDGKGMSEPVQKRVFEPFFTTRRGSGGSGLGLHIVYNLATQVLGGSVTCESAPGAGTQFRLVVPRLAPNLPGAATDVADGGGQ
jgi:signal transduction histidine kinase/ligand-binding sensor domain-containing protein